MKQKKTIKANIIQEDLFNDKIIKISVKQDVVKKKDNNVVLDSFFLDTKFVCCIFEPSLVFNFPNSELCKGT